MKRWPMWERMWDPDDWVHLAVTVAAIGGPFAVIVLVKLVVVHAMTTTMASSVA